MHLPDDDFRRIRDYLPADSFAIPGELPPPTDLVKEEDWSHALDLATDVALCTTDHQGAVLAAIHHESYEFLCAIPAEPTHAPFMHEPALLASEEFDALAFIAVHGFYRQALACLRNALETLLHAAFYAARKEEESFTRWREGEIRPRFLDSCLELERSPATAPIGALVFGPGGWARSLYDRLCAYAHSRGGYNNADFWESNGPVYRPKAFSLVLTEFWETLALSYLLLKLGWPALKISDDVVNLFGAATEPKEWGWAPYADSCLAWLQS